MEDLYNYHHSTKLGDICTVLFVCTAYSSIFMNANIIPKDDDIVMNQVFAPLCLLAVI